MGLMALAVLVPFAVIVGIFTSGSGDLEGAANGETSERKAVEGGASRRRLQTTYDFATQLEMTVCLTEDHTTDSASVSAEQVRAVYSSWRANVLHKLLLSLADTWYTALYMRSNVRRRKTPNNKKKQVWFLVYLAPTVGRANFTWHYTTYLPSAYFSSQERSIVPTSGYRTAWCVNTSTTAAAAVYVLVPV